VRPIGLRRVLDEIERGDAGAFGSQISLWLDTAGLTMRAPHEQTRLFTGQATLSMRPQLGQQK